MGGVWERNPFNRCPSSGHDFNLVVGDAHPGGLFPFYRDIPLSGKKLAPFSLQGSFFAWGKKIVSPKRECSPQSSRRGKRGPFEFQQAYHPKKEIDPGESIKFWNMLGLALLIFGGPGQKNYHIPGNFLLTTATRPSQMGPLLNSRGSRPSLGVKGGPRGLGENEKGKIQNHRGGFRFPARENSG